MVLLISVPANIGVTKPIFLDSGSPRGEGGFMRAWAWFDSTYIKLKEKALFSLSLTAICAEVCICCQIT